MDRLSGWLDMVWFIVTINERKTVLTKKEGHCRGAEKNGSYYSRRCPLQLFTEKMARRM
jgi:hypothetical protein